VTANADAGSARVSARTDAQGDFRLALPPGPYTIRIVAAGFLDEVQRVRASEDGAESREFVLIVAGGQRDGDHYGVARVPGAGDQQRDAHAHPAA
jgi:hypothetical protein